MTEPLHRHGIAGLLALYRAGEAMPSAVVEAAFERIAALNGDLNAFVELDEPGAMQAAAESDRQILSAAPRALEGVPVAIKANIDVEGLVTSAGIKARKDCVAAADAKVVADLRNAGAIVLGTLNMEEAALGAKTDNPWLGAAENPHRIGHTPGGSSGGSGAAVAAGLCVAALGTDTLGSVRVPAAYCGVYGLKPTYNAISQHGLEICEGSFDAIGPLARSLSDLEIVARELIDFADPQSIGTPVTLAGFGDVECEPAVVAVYEKAAGLLDARGTFALPDPLSRIRFAGFIRAARALHDHLADLRAADPDGLSENLKYLIDIGPKRSDADLAEDAAVLARTREALHAAVDAHGAILLPTVPQAAFPHSEQAPVNQADFTCLANIAGLPSISIPAGADDDGLPVAVQLIGAAGNEAGLFDLARGLDLQLDGYRLPDLF
ncbi:MAG: amidase [Parasphingopyxis sp.]|uniref:amidase n=1 Tax=Parasphingopyxis sp. TaxID=1920299 RepID=UPI003F9F45BF